jgi:hypothetical protein
MLAVEERMASITVEKRLSSAGVISSKFAHTVTVSRKESP